MAQEHVVLLDEDGNNIGTTPKATVHHGETPLHLAFSSYLVNDAGQVLLTQRALGKKTFPGVWTNSCCGHPADGESMADAVRRRVKDELGLDVGQVELILPRFRYVAEQDGIVENELCPVFRARAYGEVAADPSEVEAARWVDWSELLGMIDDPRLSTWCRLQLEQLRELGEHPDDWPVGDPVQLPAAATP
ncbi:isopentenyl-diphosphate Delta-isomerase [Kutzneria buriramensis]|uniref:Isopentenyl-diphosphate Delta-isomerase n=1 Tax=Kutzneria buriramensis TaxID=1045776 RepID=A0A3E0H1P0_9PSEU|nr:isopentenyl-diphosphate Delta-isomerase [Kutzneria buriramensis]REH37022.1 isopentenyl-diphosphate delta-isomerase [Kutzneria buriramensis]